MKPIIYIVIPCYNEQEVLPVTAPMFLQKINDLYIDGKISEQSKILFVNDGSSDNTWQIINELSELDSHYCGISLSRNRGHQNALLAGLSEAAGRCDACISIDCDGQDDINAMDLMIDEFLSGSEIVYGVRSERKTDTGFKRGTAQFFYKFMSAMGVEIIYNHADYRLMSARAVKALLQFKEVNLFLRGMVPLIGFKYSCVQYSRKERLAGKSKYPLKKMLALAIDGITSLSTKPIRIIAAFGVIVTIIGLIGIIWSAIAAITGSSAAGWVSIAGIICFLGGAQLLSIGIIGEYIGKIYLEVKQRPRFIIDKKTDSIK